MAYGNRLTRALYHKSPAFVQDLACTIYGYRHRQHYRGDHFWSCFRVLQQNQWKPTDEILRLQWERLTQLLHHAFEHVPYYREQWKKLGLTPDDVRSMDDFRMLPLLDKETVRQQGELFLSTAFDRCNLHPVHTSGTTGKQLTLWVSQEAYEREYSFRWHHYSWSGTAIGGRIAYLAGHPVIAPDSTRPPFSRHNYAEQSLIFSSQHLSEQNLSHYVRELRSFNPDLIEGYPSSVYLLAVYINANGIKGIRPNAVYTTSETLFDSQRKAIEQAFGCHVFNWYGNTERAGNITQCPAGSLHVQHEHAVTEILDGSGRAVREGKTGILTFTALGNFAFPLIRYTSGDTAISKRGECVCKRGGELVQAIVGRVEDYVVAPDGRYFGRLDHIFKDTEKVREAQIIQDGKDHLTFRIVTAPGYTLEDANEILHQARARLGTAFRIDIVPVTEIPRERNGKFRFVLCLLKPEEKPIFAPAVAPLDEIVRIEDADQISSSAKE
jgi:phenylacetate-CoA ligase